MTQALEKRLGKELKELAAEVKKKTKAAGKKSSRLSKKGSIAVGESADPSAASPIPSKRRRQSKFPNKALAAEELCVETTKRGDSDQAYLPVTDSAVPAKRAGSKATKAKPEKKTREKPSKTTEKSKVTVAPLKDNKPEMIAPVKKKAAEEAKST